MSQAVVAVVEHIFDNTDLTRLFATTYEHNAASMRVLEKAGFQKVGVMHKAEIKTAVDMHYYELVKESDYGDKVTQRH